MRLLSPPNNKADSLVRRKGTFDSYDTGREQPTAGLSTSDGAQSSFVDSGIVSS
jgi:hypothetical protein